MATNPSRARDDASVLAFERLYRRHRGDVYRSVLRDVRNPADAEDVTQTAFLNAYRALRRGSEPDRPRAWLLTIAQNVTRRSFRARASRPQEVELDAEALAAPEPEGPSAGEIRAALARLRPSQRAALVLREIGGLSYAEIAQTLELSVAAVETLLFRARRALREELAAAEERPVVRLGGIALWPLPAALSEAVAPVTAWVGSRGLAAKLAGAVGATIIGTGAAVQAGALPDAGADRRPAGDEPVAASPLHTVEAASARAAAAKPGAKKAKKAKKEKAEARGDAAQPGADEPAAAPSAPGSDGPVGSPGLPVLGEASLEVPQVSVPAVPAPELPVPPTPELPLEPEATVPEAELPPLPDAGELLP
ncbi:MAG TPA: sigma-70 family RNA polymerase sigma factor [Gaiellaceae bacterium]|nr:sigma-70 family RNA polymerase sigma factor [Gaiellaceae bacterium]